MYYNQSIKKFPKNGFNKQTIIRQLRKAFENNINYKNDFIIGYPGSMPFKSSIDALIKFLPLNANNIGTHTRLESEAGFQGTQDLERQAIAMIADLFNADDLSNLYDGYISSGGTEGCIEGLWILRNMINIEYKLSACFLITSLTHYSAIKAFDLLGIHNFYTIPLEKDLSMDILALEDKIRSLVSVGHKCFVIICTLGYTVTGSVDLIKEINNLGEVLEKEFDIKFFIHIDASHGGFIYPFLIKNKIGFNLKKVMTISLDAHKTGLIPYSCGIFLCRKNLQRYIETNVDYIRNHYDDTLIGSRSGAIAASLWVALVSNGKDGYRKIYCECNKNKKYFIAKLKKSGLKYWYYSHKLMNIIAVQFKNFPNEKLPKYIEKKYGLNQAQIKINNESLVVYKIVFMPHVVRQKINYFIADIQASLKLTL